MRLWPVALLAALALGVPASGATAARSGLYGIVMRGPIYPVCFENRPCDAPAAGVTVIFSRGGRVVKKVETNRKGKYRLRLRAGAYRVSFKGWGRRPIAPRIVRVPRRRFLRVEFYIDTGIR